MARRVVLASLAMVLVLATFAPYADAVEPKSPTDWCRPERGYFMDTGFIIKPPRITPDDVVAARARQDPHAEDLYWKYKQQQTGQPIEMQFGPGTLRINAANLYDQFYLPGPSCR